MAIILFNFLWIIFKNLIKSKDKIFLNIFLIFFILVITVSYILPAYLYGEQFYVLEETIGIFLVICH